MSQIGWCPFVSRQAASRAVSAVLLCALASTGCAPRFRPAPKIVTNEEKALLRSEVAKCLSDLEREGEANSVINLTAAAHAALPFRWGDHQRVYARLIDEALDEAIRRIESVYADTPEARKARSVWHEEASKDFKGEPYERAFVFLLRGLRYYEKGDYFNARACFESGIVQDCLSVEGKFNADMATFDYLVSLCCLKTGLPRRAREAWERVTRMRWCAEMPTAEDNLLVVAFAGSGPVKARTGADDHILLILKTPPATEGVWVASPWLASAPCFQSALLSDDMGYQAITRGGRAVDEINRRKSTIKRGADAAANAGIVGASAAMVASGSNDARIVAAAILALALVVKAIVSLMRTEADTRAITCVPSHIYLWSGRCLPGRQALAIETKRNGVRSRVWRDVSVPLVDSAVVFLWLP